MPSGFLPSVPKSPPPPPAFFQPGIRSSWPASKRLGLGLASQPPGRVTSPITCWPAPGLPGTWAAQGGRCEPPWARAPAGLPERSAPPAAWPWEDPSSRPPQAGRGGHGEDCNAIWGGPSLPSSLVKAQRHSRAPTPALPSAGTGKPPGAGWQGTGGGGGVVSIKTLPSSTLAQPPEFTLEPLNTRSPTSIQSSLGAYRGSPSAAIPSTLRGSVSKNFPEISTCFFSTPE